MNCANHPSTPNVAFCRTCGKALCASCTRDVQGVIYCETCLAERLHGVQPPQTVYQQVMEQGAGLKVPPVAFPGPGPNAALAGILSIFPGVGTVYCGQYVKGFAYMGIFVFLILGTIHVSGLVFGLALGFAFGQVSRFHLDQETRFDLFNEPELFLFGRSLSFEFGGEPLSSLGRSLRFSFSVAQ